MMLHDRICHDAAYATTASILECISNCLRPEEHAIAFEEIYRRVKAGIETYVVYAQRQQRHLEPGRN